MPEESFLDATEKELIKLANACHDRAGSALQVPPQNVDDFTRLRLFLEAQLCLTEVIRKRAEQTAKQDRDTEHRRFVIELVLTVLIVLLIGAEIGLSIHYGRLGLSEGRRQAAILDQMNKNTKDTAMQIQRAAEAMTASLEILRQERDERAKKPRLALYVGSTLLDKAIVHLVPRAGSAQNMASFVLLLKNEGEAPASPSEIHMLVPEGIYIALSPLLPVPEFEEPSKPATRTISYAVPLTPVGKTFRVSCEVGAPKGYAQFKATFTLTTAQLQAVTPLGSLTILPPKP